MRRAGARTICAEPISGGNEGNAGADHYRDRGIRCHRAARLLVSGVLRRISAVVGAIVVCCARGQRRPVDGQVPRLGRSPHLPASRGQVKSLSALRFDHISSAAVVGPPRMQVLDGGGITVDVTEHEFGLVGPYDVRVVLIGAARDHAGGHRRGAVVVPAIR